MNAITRHNYEEYFILYMDNELSAEERRSVEAFVQLHPDLNDELDLLLQSKLEPDTSIQYTGKEELMFANMNAIGLSNYEEWLTLYIDNELQPEERLAVEQFAAQHPVVADELYILQQTKLPVETIEFPHKESLYRREEKERRIGWWKIAAAAAIVLGIVGTIIVATNNKKGSNKGVAKNNGTQEKVVPVNNGQTDKQEQPQNIQPQQDIAIATPPLKQDDKLEVVSVDPKKNNTIRNKQSLDNKKKEDAILVKTNNLNNLPKPLGNPNVTITNDNDVAKRNNYELVGDPEILTNPAKTSADPSVTYARLTSLDQQTSPIAKIGDDDQQDGKKNKLRGFLRKVTRTFEKTTNISATDDDDRLLVGGLAIRLK